MALRSLETSLVLTTLVLGLGGCPGTEGGGSEDTEGADTGAMTEASGAPTSEGETEPGTSGGSTSGPTPGTGSSSGTTDGPPAGNCDENDLSDLYTQYVEPFVSGAVASSCTECHMTGLNISLYAQDTPCDTMACMLDAGQVDLTDPTNSELLKMINMGNPESTVFDIEDEYNAMLEWIQWSAGCHTEVCGDIENACKTGTGAGSTGVNPIGDCSEDDLLASFWNTVIVDRGRCAICHSEDAKLAGTFGACPCENENQLCVDGVCYAPGPYMSPSTFHGTGMLDYNDPDDQRAGMNTLYDMAALANFDAEKPHDSTLMTKPLLEGFQPTAIYGNNITLENIPDGEGLGIAHEGTSKFNFGCHMEPCEFPMTGPVDCRTDTLCGGGDGGGCGAGYECVSDEQFGADVCRVQGSLCDHTYVNYLEFLTYFGECK